MSVSEHERSAIHAENRAVEHESLYDPEASTLDSKNCVEVCLRVNPTDEHRSEAARLRRVATAHRRASLELRVAEERSCAGIREELRDITPFFFDQYILGAEYKEDEVIVHFASIQKTTAQDLQHLVDCHLARNAALGFDDKDMPNCPLSVEGVRAEVTKTPDGFDVSLTASTDETFQEIGKRVHRLTGG